MEKALIWESDLPIDLAESVTLFSATLFFFFNL